ncbi:MAG: CPBP family intramembrane glutamic endopeptidase [Planctomycetota bacterium]
MPDTGPPSRPSFAQRLQAALRIPELGDPRALFEVRRVAAVPGPVQVAAVVALFVAAVFLSNAEYRTTGTAFGFAGPGFNALVCPIYEELIFRGWLLGRLVRWRGPAVGIAVSSLLFGVLHLRNVYWLDGPALARMVAWAIIVVGPVFGWVALRCRSLWPTVILHYVNNRAYYLHH